MGEGCLRKRKQEKSRRNWELNGKYSEKHIRMKFFQAEGETNSEKKKGPRTR